MKTTAKTALKTGSNMVAGGIANEAIDELFTDTEQEISLNSLHQELQTQISISIEKGSKKGFLFFIDDLDRINPPVAVQILELLKNIFDLEHCIFILAIDYDVVVKGLEPKFGKKTQENEREFRSFFEKIIQLPFTMPVGQYQVNNLILNGLNSLSYFDNSEIPEKEKEEIVEISNLTVGSNPRAIKRLLNSLSLVKNISRSVANEHKLTLVEEIINIGVFSIQISYPYVHKVLERYPDFTQWNSEVIEEFKLDIIDKEKKEQLEKSEFFNDEWEQVLYQICQKDKFLSNRAMSISRLLNLINNIIERYTKEVEKSNGETDVISLEEAMRSAIEVSSVTSYSDNEEEAAQIKEIHRSSYLKSLRGKIYNNLINTAKENDIEIDYIQKGVRSVLRFRVKKGDGWDGLHFELVIGSKYYLIKAGFQVWHYIKSVTNDFQKNLDTELAQKVNARERYESAMQNVEILKTKLPEKTEIRHWIQTNYGDNSVCFRIEKQINDAWAFLEDDEALDTFVKNVVDLLVATKEIKVIDVKD
ncbi:hypothetical protein GO491_05035 [Flavobacteriaceae bacterium Ap0902]|nr:hypothetical protein [Flavobacteriaceae bacterium Ap0902]